jgi:hypothetical protein
MADIAAQLPAREHTRWLIDLKWPLRGRHRRRSYAVPLDQWCGGHENEFIAFAAQAAQRLARRGSITAQAAGWIVLDGDPITWRGQGTVDTEPVVIFVNATIDIIRRVYPHPPGRPALVPRPPRRRAHNLKRHPRTSTRTAVAEALAYISAVLIPSVEAVGSRADLRLYQCARSAAAPRPLHLDSPPCLC